MKLIKKILLYLTAFNPMVFLLLLSSIIQIQFSDELSWNKQNIIVISSFLIFLIITFIIAVIFVKKPLRNDSCKVVLIEVKNLTDSYFLGYFALFVMLDLSFDLMSLESLIIPAILIIIIGVVYISNDLYYINPLFNLFGYKFFDIKYQKNNVNKQYSGRIFSKNNLEKYIDEEIEMDYSIYNFSKQRNELNKIKK